MPSCVRHALIVIGIAGAACTARSAPSPELRADSARIRADVEHLASDALEGRATGTAGNDSAAAFVARHYASLGLEPGAPQYMQRFTARSAFSGHTRAAGLPTQNVVAVLRGTDSAVAGQAIVIGAHIDHLGRGAAGALDPEAGDAIRNGADDNASGTAAVMELARLFASRPARRTLIFAHFSAEELGLLGSQHFVDHPPVPTDSMLAMLNFDMVGRLRGDSLIVYGVATAQEFPALLDSANAATRLAVRGLGDGFGPSDHASFYARGLPVLHFFTNLHDDYHRATDDAAAVSAHGVARVVAFAERLIRAIDARPARLTFTRSAAEPAPARRRGSNVYLGSVPDMAAADGRGLRLSGVRAGSPADSAGLRAGDVIVEFDGKRVADLQTYSDALYARSPGDVVDMVVLRGSERLRLQARLGRRP